MLYLCIDQGGSSTRSVICDKDGNILTKSQVSVSTKRNHDMVEQDPEQIVSSIFITIDECLSQLSQQQKNHLQSVSLVCQRSSLIAFDINAKRPLTNIISWQDTRAKSTLDCYNSRFSEIQEITGLKPNAHYGISKMLWLIENETNVNKAYKEMQVKFLPLASYLVYALTQKNSQDHKFVVDPANASRTMLMDLSSATWSKELLETFNLNEDSLPEIQNTIEDYGELNIENTPLPLKYVNGDQSAAFYAFGKPKQNRYLVNLGTGAFISTLRTAITKGLPSSDSSLLKSIVHQDEKQKTEVLEGTVNGAGAALDEMSKQLSPRDSIKKKSYFNQPENQHNNENQSQYQEQEQKHPLHASSIDVPSSIPIFINGIGGVGSPFWLPSLKSYFIGSGDNSAKLQAVRESIAFYIVTNIEYMKNEKNRLSNTSVENEEFSSLRPNDNTEIFLSGGLSKDDNLVQLIAELTNMPIFIFKESEASILGCVWWLAGQPLDWQHSKHIKIVLPTDTYESVPNYNTKKNLLQRFKQWRKEMTSLC